MRHIAIVLFAVAWMGGPSHAATPEEIACGEYQALLGLDAAAHDRCLTDEAYRAEIAAGSLATWGPAFVARHNAALAALAAVAEPESYQPVAGVTALPDELSRDQELLGRRYAVEAILFYETGEMLPGLAKAARLFNPENPADWPARADVSRLDAAQKDFLDRHCWVNLGGLATSACRGRLYLEAGPSTQQEGGIALYLLGADFAPADAEQLQQALSSAQ